MQNLRKIINARLVNNAKNYKKYVSKPSFESQKIFSENFIAINEIRFVLTLAKPIYVGFSVLELSKYFMFDFHYNYIQRKYNPKLVFTSTDSLVYEIETNEVYEDFQNDKYLLDLSNYPKDSEFFYSVSEKVNSKTKDVSTGKINDEFVRLK